jgi:hypothetical protein
MLLLSAAVILAGCETTNSTGGDSVWEAMRKGAVAGLQEGLTGQEQPNPYLSGNGDSQPQVQPEQAPAQQLNATELASRFGAKDAGLIAQGHIDIGMTADEVMLAWGDPKARKPSGHSKVIWDYGDDKVTFTKGKVSAVTH